MTRQKIQRLEKFIVAHKGIVVIIRRIPPEIIQIIFQWLSAILRWEAKLEPKWALPFAYGQICSSWRDIALSVHSLWSLFPEIRKLKTRIGKGRQVKYMTELLHRSRQSPIQFSIDVGNWNEDQYLIRDLLIQSSGRWQVVNIRGTTREICVFCRQIQGHIPNLESLEISAFFSREIFHPLDIFETAPKLREVKLSGYETSDIKLPTHQLIDFSSLTSYNRNPLSPLINAHHLENLTYGAWKPVPIININMISLPNLKRLHVQVHPSPPSILDFLTIPILECLHISVMVMRAVDTTLLRSLVKMASRSELGNLPHLRELRIWSRSNEMREGFDDLLRLTPALRVLEIPIPSPRDTYTHSRINEPLPMASLAG